MYKDAVSARTIDSTLVAVFRKSEPPVVWKFDLERNHSFTLALQGEEGELELGVTTPKGEFYSVARFSDRRDADQAFAAVQTALMRGSSRWIVRLLKWIVWLVGIGLAVILIGSFLAEHNLSKMLSGGAPVIRNGVPMPADQVLQPPGVTPPSRYP